MWADASHLRSGSLVGGRSTPRSAPSCSAVYRIAQPASSWRLAPAPISWLAPLAPSCCLAQTGRPLRWWLAQLSLLDAQSPAASRLPSVAESRARPHVAECKSPPRPVRTQARPRAAPPARAIATSILSQALPQPVAAPHAAAPGIQLSGTPRMRLGAPASAPVPARWRHPPRTH